MDAEDFSFIYLVALIASHSYLRSPDLSRLD
jgi:hypothetical protein